MPRPKLTLNQFSKGFISEHDIDPTDAPPDSLADMLNFEVNSPAGLLESSPGLGTGVAVPDWSGSQTVAARKFSVDTPSAKDVVVLVRKSKNLLRWSEDFFDTASTAALDTAIMDNNLRYWRVSDFPSTWDINYTVGPAGSWYSVTRRADYFIAAGAVPYTTLHQMVKLSEVGLAVGDAVTFSVYLYDVNDTGSSIDLKIREYNSSGTVLATTTATVSAGQSWDRYTVTRTINQSTCTYIEVLVATLEADISWYIWGAQLEKGSTATTYHPSYIARAAYSIWMRPYWSGTAWVDVWQDLTEQRIALLRDTGFTSGQKLEVAGAGKLGDANDDFYGWTVTPIFYSGTATSKNFKQPLRNEAICIDYVYSTDDIYVANNRSWFGNSYTVLLSRNPVTAKQIWANGTTYAFDTLSSLYDNGKPISFQDLAGGLSISIPSTAFTQAVPAHDAAYDTAVATSVRTSFILRYWKNSNVYNANLAFDGFYLMHESPYFAGYSAITDDNYVPVYTEIAASASGGDLTAVEWMVYVIAVRCDGSYIPASLDYVTTVANGKIVNGTTTQSGKALFVKGNPFPFGIDAYMIFVGPTAEGIIGAYHHQTISVGAATWAAGTDSTGGFQFNTAIVEITDFFGATGIQTLEPSLWSILQRQFLEEAGNSRVPCFSDSNHAYSAYVLGRRFTAGHNGTSRYGQGDADTVRYSHIRDVVEEPALLPTDYNGAWDTNRFYVYANRGDQITGLAKTKGNDLLVFKGESVSIYSVGSKRIFTALDGVGCATGKSIISNDYGIFWYDYNGVHQYTISGELRHISEGKLEKYWKEEIRRYIATSFAFWNPYYEEYWIAIQVTGSTIPSTTASEYRIFRYAPRYDNWTIYRTNQIIRDAYNGRDGLLYLATDSNIYQWGYNTSTGAKFTAEVPAGFIQTQKLLLGSGADTKQIQEIGVEYAATGTAPTLALFINDETTARSGNTLTLSTSFKSWRKQVRQSSWGRFFTLKFTSGAATSDITVRLIEIYAELLKDRYRYGRS